MAFGKSGNKEVKTAWMQKLNDMRKIVMHPAKQQAITFEQLAQLRDYHETLTQNLQSRESAPNE